MVGVFTQCRCFTYINIFNPSALHILPYLILYAPLWGTIPIFKMWKLYSFQYQCRFLWQLVFNRAFVGVLNQHGFIFSAQQGPEWLLTHYRILRRCVINYVPISIECHQFQTAAGMVSIIFWAERPFLLFPKIKIQNHLFGNQQGSLGAKAMRSHGSGPPDTNHVMCPFLWATLHPAQEKRPRRGCLGSYSTNWGLKAGVCDPGRLGTD